MNVVYDDRMIGKLGPGVSRERWREAQDWERGWWDHDVRKAWRLQKFRFVRTLARILSGEGPGDDHNYWWAQQFEDYEFVPSQLNNVVEFGCGPYTNLRLILKNRTANHVFASDPLAKHYIRYRGFQLRRRWKRGEYMIDDHPLEEAPFASGFFDLVVCINVLDHVRSPEACLRQLDRVTGPGGIVVLGQDLTNAEDVARGSSSSIGHPHVFDDTEALLAHFDGFTPLLDKVLPREQGRAPSKHYGTLVYAGRKTP